MAELSLTALIVAFSIAATLAAGLGIGLSWRTRLGRRTALNRTDLGLRGRAPGVTSMRTTLQKRIEAGTLDIK